MSQTRKSIITVVADALGNINVGFTGNCTRSDLVFAAEIIVSHMVKPEEGGLPGLPSFRPRSPDVPQ